VTLFAISSFLAAIAAAAVFLGVDYSSALIFSAFAFTFVFTSLLSLIIILVAYLSFFLIKLKNF